MGGMLLALVTSLALSPPITLKHINKRVAADSVFIHRFDSIYFHPQVSSLTRELAYKEALLKLSGNDSIQMVVNLQDSTVGLSIKGLAIHQTKVKEFKADGFFRKMPLLSELYMVSEPVNVSSQYATIVKEPVVVRHAPKDTAEAASDTWQPDTLIQNPAFFVFILENNIRLYFEQDVNNNLSDKWMRFVFYIRTDLHGFADKLKYLLRFRTPVYQPGIIIKIPADDLRAIYRALPSHPMVVIKIH